MGNFSKIGVAVLVVIIAPLAGCVGIDMVLRARAKPPPSVTDVASCLVWLERSMGAYRVRSGESVYYEITGPAGRMLPSGPAGYAFDQSGKLIGWSADIGDIKTPREIFGGKMKWEPISTSELQRELGHKAR